MGRLGKVTPIACLRTSKELGRVNQSKEHMSISPDTQKHMESVAGTTLETFETISAVARTRLLEPPPAPEKALMNVNTFTSRNGVGTLERILTENRMSLRSLLGEPAIARVVTTNDDGERRTYFVCRTSPVPLPANAAQLASYRSPVGLGWIVSITPRIGPPRFGSPAPGLRDLIHSQGDTGAELP